MAAFPVDTIVACQTAEAPNPQCVADYCIGSVPTARPEETAREVRERLTDHKYDDASHVFLVDEARLVGVAKIGDIMCAGAATPLAAIARENKYPVVTLATDREQAASIAIHAGVSVLGVCDADRRFVGALPASALISILRDEHLEDLHHMAGILGRSEAARAALAAPPWRRAAYRLPWLLVGMAGSAVATATMAHFEAVLTTNIAVAFFIPSIVYLADAVGTQTEVVAVRALSFTGSSLASLLVGEVGTGILIGLALGLIAYSLVLLTFGNMALAATVAAALAVASSVSTTVGFLLPWLFAKFGYDPALGSGPVATVFQDVSSLMIYFWIASTLVL